MISIFIKRFFIPLSNRAYFWYRFSHICIYLLSGISECYKFELQQKLREGNSSLVRERKKGKDGVKDRDRDNESVK